MPALCSVVNISLNQLPGNPQRPHMMIFNAYEMNTPQSRVDR